MSTEEMLVNGSTVVAVSNGQLLANGITVVPEHSLHFGHVSQVPHSYGISGLQNLSYGAFPMHQEGQLAPNSYPLPDPALLTQQRKTERRRPPGKKDLNIPHIPRPRNAFILFRSAFIEQKNGKELASKQQNLSRIAAMVWKSMNSAEQDPWYKLASEEKQAHYAANPGYTFQPTGRTEANKKKTRKPAMEPAVEENSCKQIADLIINGVQGEDLVAAAKSVGVAPWPKLQEGGSGGRRRREAAQDESMFEYIDDEGSSEGDPKQYQPASPSQYQHAAHTGYEY